MKINHWFEARQYEIEKAGGQNYQLLIMLFWTYLTASVSEFQHFVVLNKESWEKGGITDTVILMNDVLFFKTGSDQLLHKDVIVSKTNQVTFHY